MEHPLERLLDEVRLLWRTVSEAGVRSDRAEAVTSEMRAVLLVLRREGPAPVPAIARSRRVSRQRIQCLVDRLRRLQLVALAANPEHRRSALVRLTRRGLEHIDSAEVRDRQRLARLALSRQRLTAAAATLRAVREALEDDG